MFNTLTVEVFFPLPLPFLTTVVVEVVVLGVVVTPGIGGSCFICVAWVSVLPLPTPIHVAVLVIGVFVTLALFNDTGPKL